MKQIAPIKQLNTFFDQFALALENYDTKTMAHLYEMPCTLLSDDATTVFTEPVKLEGFFNRGASVYKQVGVYKVRAEIWNRQIWTQKMLMVKMKWRYANQLGEEIYTCDYNYIMKQDREGNLKIVMSVSLNEKEQMEEWQKKNSKK